MLSCHVDDSIIVGRESFWNSTWKKIESQLVIGEAEDINVGEEITFCGRLLRFREKHGKVTVTTTLNHYSTKLQDLGFLDEVGLKED